MNIMKHALMKRKGDLEKNFKVTIEVSPNGKDDEKEEAKMDLAPTVKDQEDSNKAHNPSLEPKDDKLDRMDSDKEPIEVGDPTDGARPVHDLEMISKGMPEMPNGREPMTLGEKAQEHMQKDIKSLKMKRK